MLAHKFVEQSLQSDVNTNKQNVKRFWWSFGQFLFLKTEPANDEADFKGFTETDWERLSKIIGYKKNSDEYLLSVQDKELIQFSLEVHMKHNTSKLIIEGQECLADLSCEGFICNMRTYAETKIFDWKLGSYHLFSPYGLLAEVLDDTFASHMQQLLGKALSSMELRLMVCKDATVKEDSNFYS